MKVKFGIDRLITAPPSMLYEGPVGVVTNAAATTADLRTVVEGLTAAGVEVTAIFAPEHGFSVHVPAGQKVDKTIEPITNIPVYSLYGERLSPQPDILAALTRIIIDLPDVGSRFYTYESTLVHVLRATAKAHVPVLILDRPNPIDGVHVEGPILRKEYTSFVGMLPIPIRHGMTLGELAELANDVLNIGAHVDVLRVQGWQREHMADMWTRPWVPPSPNMPGWETALLYPGSCLAEGTNLSEGRGTPYPFAVVGAPWIEGHFLAEKLNSLDLSGVRFRPTTFIPCRSKYADTLCAGVQIHVTHHRAFQPVRTGIALLHTIHKLYPDDFAFLPPAPGQALWPFDRLIGDGHTRPMIEAGASLDAIIAPWEEEEQTFRQQRRRYILEED